MRRIVRTAAGAAMLIAMSACVKSVGPVAPVPREAVPVAAPFDATWNAAVDVLADLGLTVATMERESGLITLREMPLPPSGVSTPNKTADCGRDPFGTYTPPAVATYSVVVRRSGATATVLARANYKMSSDATWSCTSHGAWEQRTEQAVKTRAEGAAARH